MPLIDTTLLPAATDREVADALASLIGEQERRRVVAVGDADAARKADAYAAAVGVEKPLDHKTLPDAIGPGRRIVWTDGQTWRNTSGAWLPRTATPATFPQGWAKETGLPASTPAWKAGEQVKVGDLRTEAGTTYRVLQAHTTQAGWAPSATPALWAKQG